MRKMKEIICGVIGLCGSFIASLFGGWSEALTTLIIFMAIDYITGLVVGGVFHTSTKTPTGALQSKACWKGLCLKGVTLLIVIIAHRLDLLLNCDYVMNAVCIAFITNETISIIENAGLMGFPIPKVIIKAIDILKSKTDEEEE
mgnify:CR=1 FL=1